jgi:hypothetical protein
MFSFLRRSCLAIALLTSCFAFFTTKVSASQNFNAISIRFDRMKAGVSPGNSIVTFTTSSAIATEAKFNLNFDSHYVNGVNLSSNPSAYTTDTINIPAGSIALPLTSTTATSVVGQNITFSISDLNPNTTYSFVITGGILLNPNSGSFRNVFYTSQSDNTVIDTQNVWTATLADDQIKLTATVPPLATNFPVTIDTSATSPIAQDSEIPVTITYGSGQSTSSPLTITANWDKGVVQSDPQTQVDMLEYVDQSATNAYGNTVPTVDLVNKTITWNISVFPGNLQNQTLSFKLRTNSAYVGSKDVSLNINAQVTAPITGGQVSVGRTYKYVAIPTAAATTSTASIQTPNTYSALTLSQITNNSVTLFVSGANNFSATLLYGLSPKNLSQKIFLTDPKLFQTFQISNLLANTQYYFEIVMVDINTGTSSQSDI